MNEIENPNYIYCTRKDCKHRQKLGYCPIKDITITKDGCITFEKK
jgi:hypothetical protein